MTMQEAMAALGLSISAVFVPWSQSRNFDPKATPDKRTLNWRVSVMLARPDMSAPVDQNGQRPLGVPVPILLTDYQAGCGHCPSYKQNARWTLGYSALIEFETEQGCVARSQSWGIVKGKPILPKAEDVLASLALDASAIDSATYEDWSAEYGYDADSRKGEAIYRACLETGLKLRAALGEAGLATLRDAAAEW